jgi:hypothetical protein
MEPRRRVGSSPAKASSWPLLEVSKLATHSHQLLCKNWACTCLSPRSLVEAKLLLASYQSNKLMDRMRFELLLSTPSEKDPWRETEIDVVAESKYFEEPETVGSLNTRMEATC